MWQRSRKEWNKIVQQAGWGGQGLPRYFKVQEVDDGGKRRARVNSFLFKGALLSLNHDQATPYIHRNSNRLTSAEEAVLLLGAVGLDMEMTVAKLGSTPATVNKHQVRIYRKLCGPTGSQGSATVQCFATGIFSVEKPMPARRQLPIRAGWAEVLQGIAENRTVEEIADDTSRCHDTIKHRISHMYNVLGVQSRGGLVMCGILAGAVELPETTPTPPTLVVSAHDGPQ